MAVHTIEFDRQTEEIITGLMRAFKVTTTADVISRALAVAEEARRFAEPGSVIVITGQQGNTKIDLAS